MYCLGLISGTSVDGIDATLVEITGEELDLAINFVSGITYHYSDPLRQQILAVCGGKPLSMEELSVLDDAIALAFCEAVESLPIDHSSVELIGSHGQTVFHRPPTPEKLGYTLQLGRGELIANQTKIPTVSNFRVADMAVGGQGAPLVSKVDAYILSHPNYHRCVQNIGGIGNVTYLPARYIQDWENKVIGWDTGPGNVLIDLATQKLTNGQKTYDNNGEWAAQGTPHQGLIQQWLDHEFFQQLPPKSTGRELFSPDYLDDCWQSAQQYQLSDADFLATITDFTAASIADSYRQFIAHPIDEILVCGGGSCNGYLLKRIQHHYPDAIVKTTTDAGMNSDFKEAIAFAVLAYWRFVAQIPGNLPNVTGAKKPMLLGEIHLPCS